MLTPQEWQNVHLASPVQELAVEANVLPGTYHARHEAPFRVSRPPLDAPSFYEHPRAALSSRSRYGTALETSQSIP